MAWCRLTSLRQQKWRQMMVENVTVGGSLSVVLAKADGQEIHRWEKVQTSQFMIQLQAPGDYLGQVEARDHQGSYWIKLVESS